jgi:hypothetical protein
MDISKDQRPESTTKLTLGAANCPSNRTFNPKPSTQGPLNPRQLKTTTYLASKHTNPPNIPTTTIDDSEPPKSHPSAMNTADVSTATINDQSKTVRENQTATSQAPSINQKLS